MYVEAVERSDEGHVHPPNDVVGQLVSLVLQVEDATRSQVDVAMVMQQLEQLAGGERRLSASSTNSSSNRLPERLERPGAIQ
jgi:hypothetical protein